ncbi:unnamed protein product [Rotaria socialis]|uniref:Uncharacterized protein n=1 Tax=Rotaria socialis TaxID=392032 RepID=A0A818W6D9_9BILA|nr:unnamed protein product [Rotaria socialis]CAF4687871.1 unnamed protein product [Rotaria socialis]
MVETTVQLKDDLELRKGFETCLPQGLPDSVTALDWANFISGANAILSQYDPHQLFSGTFLAGLAGFLSPISHEITRQKLHDTGMNLLGYVDAWNAGYFWPKNMRVYFHEDKVSVSEINTEHMGKMIWRQICRLGTGDYKRFLVVHFMGPPAYQS